MGGKMAREEDEEEGARMRRMRRGVMVRRMERRGTAALSPALPPAQGGGRLRRLRHPRELSAEAAAKDRGGVEVGSGMKPAHPDGHVREDVMLRNEHNTTSST